MKRTFATMVRNARKRLIIFALLAVLGCLANVVAAHAQSASTASFSGSLNVVRGYQETSSYPTPVVLMTIPGLGSVEVNCPSGPVTGIAFYPSVSGSLWWTHEGATGFASGSAATQLSYQSTPDVITAVFATATKTVTMVISGEPGATCTYAAQATVQP